MHVIIVGAGIMGLATAWSLDKAGHSVAVYDQGPIPNPLGSSYDEHRLIRRAYGGLEDYGRMIPAAYAAWEALWSDLGQRLIVDTGLLAIDTEDGGVWAEHSHAALAAAGRPGRWLDPHEVRAAYPQVTTDGMTGALWHPDGGVLLAGSIGHALAEHLAGRPGVTLHPHCAVRDVDPERGRIELADGSNRDADAIVVAAGAWVGRLIPAPTRHLQPSRQLVVYLSPPAGEREVWSRGPMLVELSDSLGFYLVPPVAGRGLKVGDHRFSLSGDPETDRVASAREAELLLAGCERRLTTFRRWSEDHRKVCYYTVAPDERFVIGPLGARGWLLSACSGHGFKFGALIGRQMAAAVAEGRASDLQWVSGSAPA